MITCEGEKNQNSRPYLSCCIFPLISPTISAGPDLNKTTSIEEYATTTIIMITRNRVYKNRIEYGSCDVMVKFK